MNMTITQLGVHLLHAVAMAGGVLMALLLVSLAFSEEKDKRVAEVLSNLALVLFLFVVGLSISIFLLYIPFGA